MSSGGGAAREPVYVARRAGLRAAYPAERHAGCDVWAIWRGPAPDSAAAR